MAPPRRPGAVIGLDVGKSAHWACVATRDGEVLLSAPVANRKNELDSLFAEFPGALVVVDQPRNIGALALSRARAVGMPQPKPTGPRYLSMDERIFIADGLVCGLSMSAIASRLGHSRSTVCREVARNHDRGTERTARRPRTAPTRASRASASRW